MDTPTSDDIVVTGFRRSLKLANEQKGNADVVSDGISPEDVGKFPNQNLADSLQQSTGVQITRDWGKGWSVGIRRLAPGFARTNNFGLVRIYSQIGRRITAGVHYRL